jgi:protein-disulfide isomerase
MNSSITIPLAIVMGGTILAVAVYVSIPKSQPKIGGDPALVRPVGTDDHTLGNPAAPVVIIEYSDFDCTFCKDFHNTLHQIIANEGANGKVAWVYRHFPLSQIHPNALSHARASECIAKVSGNDAFWKFTDALFANQPASPSSYGELASSIGISGDAFASCYAKVPAEIEARLADDRKNAEDVGAQGTPYSLVLVAGKAPIVMNGAYSYDAVKQVIDQALIR